MIERLRTMLAEKEAMLILSRVPTSLPSGRDLRNYIEELGITRGPHAAKVFPDLSDALEWIEDQTLEVAGITVNSKNDLTLDKFELFEDLHSATLAGLQRCAQRRFYAAGEIIFTAGTPGDALMLISRGLVRIDLPLSEGRKTHLATFSRGQFFGEMSFLDHHAHSADVQAVIDTELLIIPRSDFNELAGQDPLMAMHVFSSLALAMAERLRHTNHELRALQET